MLDIDNFKKVNDTYGHDTGDSVLVQIANAVQSRLRSNDLLARVGGEEFAVLVPETEQRAAMTLANDLCATVRQIDHFHRETGQKFKVTISLGVSDRFESDTSIDEVLKRADEALYQAKRGTKDCAVLYIPS